MWSVPRRESPDERCDRLMAVYERQIADLEASHLTPFWDGYCGLVRVCDEDDVRPDSAQNTAAAAAAAVAQQQTKQQGEQRRGRKKHGDSTDLAEWVGRRPGSDIVGTQTPPLGGSPRTSSAGTSPFKPRGKQNAAVLAEQAALLLQQQGRLREAESQLHAALRACPTTDTQLAARIIDLLLEAEREAQETPSHSRAPSDVEPLEDEQLALAAAQAEAAAAEGSGGSSGGGGNGSGSAALGEVAPLLRAAQDALAAGEARRAVAALQRAAEACPAELVELRRRIELYLQLVLSKKRT